VVTHLKAAHSCRDQCLRCAGLAGEGGGVEGRGSKGGRQARRGLCQREAHLQQGRGSLLLLVLLPRQLSHGEPPAQGFEVDGP